MHVLSLDPEKAYLPSGVIATDSTPDLCSENICTFLPILRSQSMHVPSAEPEKAFPPSGVIVIAWIGDLGPVIL